MLDSIGDFKFAKNSGQSKKTKKQQLAKLVAKLLSNLHMVIKLELDCKLKAIQRQRQREREREEEEEDALSRWKNSSLRLYLSSANGCKWV